MRQQMRDMFTMAVLSLKDLPNADQLILQDLKRSCFAGFSLFKEEERQNLSTLPHNSQVSRRAVALS
jgi:hypothetical protein